MKLTMLQYLRLRVEGSVYVGDKIRAGWREPIPHYAFMCPVHGLVESYAQGYGEELRCPLCMEEAGRRVAREAGL